MVTVGNLRRLLVASAAAAATVLIATVSGAAAPATGASVDSFQQCANDGSPGTATDCPENWINGTLNSSNSHYAEDEVTPQRIVLDLPESGPTTGRTVEISYLTRKGGVHAYDSLATWNHTQSTADRCANLSAADCVPGPASTFPIPPDPTVVADNLGAGSATSAHQLGGQVFTLYGGTVTDASSYTHDDAGGTGDSHAHVTLTYSVPSTDDGAKVMLLFGGHIAASLGSRGWGVGVGAGSISGGPYHMRITGADGESVGNRDNQIQSGAILAPASLVIEKIAVGGDATFDYSSTGGIANPLSITTSGGSGSQSFANVSPGAYTVTETALPAGWDFTSLVCVDEDGGTTVTGQTANIDLDPGETATCTYTNSKKGKIVVQKETSPDGDPQSFAFTASYDAAGFSLADGQSNDSGLLVSGTYTVVETVPAGWDLQSATCDDGSSPGSIGLSPGETVTCTFTNAKRGRIVVDKVTVPAGDPQSFAFTLTGGPDAINQGFSLTHAATPRDSGLVKPGTYSAGETVPAGWSMTAATCSDGSAPDAIDLGAGEIVTCTFTNTRQGQVIVRKVMVGGTDTFEFTGTPAGSISQSDGTITENVGPGQYVSTEGAKAGWALTSVSCDDENSTGSVANRQATFDVAAGEVVTCTFTNTKQGTIVVQKETDPDGASQSFGFEASYDVDGFSLSDGQSNSSGELGPGTYSVSENVSAGWQLQSAICSDGSPADAIELGAGETVTCTFTNRLVRGRIVVEKETSPAGDPQSFAFTASYDGDGFSLSDGQSNDSGELLPGTYSVSETVPVGWDLESATCDDGSDPSSIDLASDETVICTFVNEKDANIVVSKETTPDGDPQSFAFSASYDGDGFSLSDGQSNDSGDLDAGTYSVSETVPGGWDLVSAECSDDSDPGSIDLQAGETVTCVFTNEKDANIVVSKQTSPDGSPQVFSFNASYDGDGFGLSDGQSNDSGDLAAGTYSVSENVPQGWQLTSAECSDQSDPSSVSLQAGETVTCTFTNTQAGRIVVEKQTSPDGSPQAFDFDASYDEGGFSLSDGEQDDSGDLTAGTYSVSENVPAGWELTSAVCSDESESGAIELSAGETVTCVFTNTQLGTIVVEKQTSPEGAAGSFSFSGDAAGAIGDNGQIVVSNLVPGTYASTEAVADGWSLTSITCADSNSSGSLAARTATFALEAGEVVKCTFTNAKLNLGVGAIDIQKSADPTSMKEPGGPVTFSVTITNVSPDVDATIDNVVDDRFGDLDDDGGGNGCFDVPVNLAPGEKVNCTFQRSITGPGGTVHVNTVRADGHDEFGNALTDSDNARVEITARLIDLVIVKEASSPTPLNGIVIYTLTVTNRGPDTATNVQVADPAPAGIVYGTASPSQGACNLTPQLITCSLGTIAPGQTVRIPISARATVVGTHMNTATVTGSGGRETNPADNVDSAVTVVPAPLQPPTAKPNAKPRALPDICLSLTVLPKLAKADGKADRMVVRVTAGKNRVKGVRVVVTGFGVRKTARTNGKGMAVLRVNPKKPGLITVTALETNRRVCGSKRIGVVGVFLPPLTG
jgi:uncharacterized repeat protein (TIGR01451 family)